MFNSVLNAVLLLGILFFSGCHDRPGKRNRSYSSEDAQEGNAVITPPIVIELQDPVPVLADTVTIPGPVVPTPVPTPVPVAVPVVVPDEEEDEECPLPSLVLEKKEPCIEPDHFLSYPFHPESPLPTTAVTLEDQFIEATEFAFLEGRRLLNPSTKWHNGTKSKPEHPNTHYLAVGVEPLDPVDLDFDRTFLFANQFENRRIHIPGDLLSGDDGNPVLELLVPSVKKACPNGDCHAACEDCFPEGDHFLCYELRDMENNECPLGDVRFEDQFMEFKIVDHLKPKRICNPVNKTFNNETTRASDEKTNHLVCYEVNVDRISIRSIQLLNQLGQQEGNVRGNNEICVPSLKLDITAEE